MSPVASSPPSHNDAHATTIRAIVLKKQGHPTYKADAVRRHERIAAMWHRRMAWIDPVEAASRLAGLPCLSLLDSAMVHETLGRYSYLAADPFGLFKVQRGRALWNDVTLPDPPLVALRTLLRIYHSPLVQGLPPFQGGAIGALSYEFGWSLEGRMPPARPIADDIHLAFYDTIIAFDHVEHACWIIASGWPESDRRARAQARLSDFAERLARPAPSAPQEIAGISWRPTQSRDAYRAGLERVKAYIRAGDIYQANLAQRFMATLPAGTDAWQIYRRLRAANPAPFAAYLDCGTRNILCTSPELFLRSDGRDVETRPIKGTTRRHEDAQADDAAARDLAASRKDRAENVMIVDLLRNDLSRVCEPHSVEVPMLCGVESYEGLHHLVSVVTGTLREGSDVLDLVAASFPGGSITGAPKLRAMEVIAELEGLSRGIYCGVIGAFGFDGGLNLNIAIRTLVAEGGTLELRTGGGITILSEADAEYEETLTKARSIFDGLAPTRKLAGACA